MTSFFQAFIEGMSHIFCLDALDHILYLLVLTACFDHSKLKKIFWLVTAFTIGHAVAFLLASLGIGGEVRSLAEFAIPVTIALTAIVNFFKHNDRARNSRDGIVIYFLALCFGAIHGMAIGSMLEMKLVRGQNFLGQLAGFNLGVEMAQIIVVLCILFIQMLLMGLFRIRLHTWKTAVSGIGLGAALIILMNSL